MATVDHVMDLLSESNPIPDIHSLDLDDVGGTRYLATLEKRSSEMTQTKDRPVETPKIPRRSLVPVMSAVVVLIVGTLAWLGFRPSEPEVASEGIAVVESFAEAVSAGVTDLSEFVTDEATFGPISVPLDVDLASFWAGLETTITVSNCEQAAQVVTCDYEWTDHIRRVQVRPEFGTLRVLIDGSRVGDVARSWDQEASGWLEAGDPVIHYLEWLNEAHPGWELELDWIGEPALVGGGFAPLAHDDPLRNVRYAEVLTRYLDDYGEHLTDIGGIPG